MSALRKSGMAVVMLSMPVVALLFLNVWPIFDLCVAKAGLRDCICDCVRLCSVDNSDYMRNGDFVPTRLQAQQDAVHVVCQSKTRSNPENNVGLLTLAKYVLASFLLQCCLFFLKYCTFHPVVQHFL